MENSPDVTAELTAEFVLSHVIDNVCRFLKIKDLYSVSKVCRLWQDAALHELNRLGPKIGVVPFFNEVIYQYCKKQIDILNIIHTKPRVAVMFFNRSHYRQALSEKELRFIIDKYQQKMECSIISLHSEETYFDTKRKIEFANFTNVCERDNFCIPALFLSIFKQSNITISCSTKQLGVSSAIFAQRMYKELIDNYNNSKITLILFSASQKGTNIATKLLSMIKLNHEQSQYSIWGNECYSLEIVDYDPMDDEDILEPHLLGIRLYGPNIDSCSTIIDTRMRPNKFEEELLKFKENIKLKKHNFGLVCGPILTPIRNHPSIAKVQSTQLIMILIKKVFPETHFIGEFSYEFYFSAYGCDSTSKTSNMGVSNKSVSIMIISYD